MERYSIVNLIGSGSSAKVYLARDLQENRAVAIKCIRIRSGKSSSKIQARLSQEIAILRTLHCPHIVETYDVISDVSDDTIYIVMEYCENGDLAKYMSETASNCSEDSALYYMLQLRAGLSYLHSHGILHRDLKPANLLLTNNYQTLKIADFGFAKVIERNTLATTLCGSPLYMAPEIFALSEGQSYTDKTDLWSVGLILYQLIYGRLVFGELETYAELILALRTKPIVYPALNTLSVECKDLVTSLLQKDPNLRLTWIEFLTHSWWSQPLDSTRVHANIMSFLQSPGGKEGQTSPREVPTDQTLIIENYISSSSPLSSAVVPLSQSETGESSYAVSLWGFLSSSLRSLSIFKHG